LDVLFADKRRKVAAKKHFPIFSAVKKVPFILLCIVILLACSNTHQRKEFYSTGQLKEIVNIDANNLKQDTLIIYYKDGIINHKEVYHNDTLNGPFLTYYKDGTLWVKTNYKNGVKNGLTQTFYKNQNLKWYGNYVNGNQEGTFISYYQNHKMQMKEVYRHSETLYKIIYDSLGNPSTEYIGILLNVKKQFGTKDSISFKAYIYGNYHKVQARLYKEGDTKQNICDLTLDADSSYSYRFPPQLAGTYKLFFGYLISAEIFNYKIETITVQ